MGAVDIRFPTVSNPGEKPQLSGGRLINAILEQVEGGKVNIKRAPGLLRLVTSIGDNIHCRGMIEANSGTLLVVYDEKVEAVTSLGSVSVVLGNLGGTDLVTLAKNNKTPTPDIVCVSPSNGAFTLSAAGSPTTYPDSDVESPLCVAFAYGYFIFFYADGRMKTTGLNSTSIATTDEAKVESGSDGLRRGVVYRGQIYAFTPSLCEVWQIDTNPSPSGFPFIRVAVIPRGIASTNAVAGWEAGFTQTLIWAGSDNIVYTLNGYDPVRVSTHDIERDLQELEDKTELQAFAYMHSGHPYWALKCSKWCWVRDLLTNTWQERKSYLSNTWRASQSVYMWGDWLVGDSTTGYVFRPDKESFQENASPLVWQVTSLAVDDFPQRFNVPRVDFNFAAGTGVPQGGVTTVDPSVMIEWSDDGGASWSVPIMRKIGKIGRYSNRISVNATGRASAYGRQWRLTISDPAYIGLLGGKMFTSAEAQF